MKAFFIIVLIIIIVALGAYLLSGYKGKFGSSSPQTYTSPPGSQKQQQPPASAAPELPYMQKFDNRKIVYTTDTLKDITPYSQDCQRRGGAFHSCGSTCAPDVQICAQVCALTCEFDQGGPIQNIQANISIQNFSYNPPVLNVSRGTAITWKNNDSAPHTVTADNGLFSSTQLNPGDSYRFTFNQSGTYFYHCNIHPQMRAQINVQ